MAYITTTCVVHPCTWLVMYVYINNVEASTIMTRLSKILLATCIILCNHCSMSNEGGTTGEREGRRRKEGKRTGERERVRERGKGGEKRGEGRGERERSVVLSKYVYSFIHARFVSSID